MKADFRKNNQEIRTNRWLILLTIIGIIALVVIVIICCIVKMNKLNDISNHNAIGDLSINCNDDNPCTNDYTVGAGSCTHYDKENGMDCGLDDLCFQHHVNCTPTCRKGNCIGPTECCRGYCHNDGDCITLPFIVGVTSDRRCIRNYCVYESFFTRTSNCMSLLDGPLSQCIEATFSDVGGETPDGICIYHFKCNPPNTGTGPTSLQKLQKI